MSDGILNHPSFKTSTFSPADIHFHEQHAGWNNSFYSQCTVLYFSKLPSDGKKCKTKTNFIKSVVGLRLVHSSFGIIRLKTSVLMF